MFLLRNEIQPYAWGSTRAIAELQGREPTGKPEAELWMGAHPRAPSRVEIDATLRPLDALIAEAPERWLGKPVRENFGELPFLLKILAAASPLSLQAHPNREQAQAGFDAEERSGIPLNAEQRNYRDRNHKPELLCALSEFEALCGFRPLAEVAEFAVELQVPALDTAFSPVLNAARSSQGSPEHGADALRQVFAGLFRAPRSEQASLVKALVCACRDRALSSHFERAGHWVVELGRRYPADVGVVLSLLLNWVQLNPGEALYLDAGNVHAYLQGTGVELMANSDNVLRAGLTPKHVDPEELLRIVDFRVQPIPVITGKTTTAGVTTYVTPAREFELSRLQVKEQLDLSKNEGPRILLVTQGQLTLQCDAQRLELGQGQSAWLEPGLFEFVLHGIGVAYCAAVP